MIPNAHSPSGTSLSSTGSFVSVPCSKCGGTLARRSHRDGLAEKMLSLMYVYPFRCQLCGHRFFAQQWGIHYHRVSVDHRQYHRHPAQIPVMLVGQPGEFHGKTADLSINGCTLMASGPFWKNSRWRVQLLLPYEPHPVMIDDAEVRTVRNRQISMEFLRCAPAEHERLGRLIETIWKQTVPGFFDEQLSRPIPGPYVAGMAVRSGQSYVQQ